MCVCVWGGGGGGYKQGLSGYPYLFITIELYHGGWYNQLEMMNTRLDEDNGKATVRVILR